MSSNYPPGVTGNEEHILGEHEGLRKSRPKNTRRYGVLHEHRAEIERVTDRHTYVKREDGGPTVTLTKGSIDATSFPVGTKGVLQYITGPSYGLWFFAADKPQPPTNP
jgi:hypothetical protein